METTDVLNLTKIVYVIYLLVAFSLVALFGLRLRFGATNGSPPRLHTTLFRSWIGLLVGVGVGLHLLTYHKIPWVKWDLNRHQTSVDREYDITVANHAFHLPQKQLQIKKGEMVRFNLTSQDYTYGFGLFRDDGSMIFQMQVVPGRVNDLIWRFDTDDTYTIRSTEYSGPRGADLMARSAVIVTSDDLISQNDMVVY